MAVGGHVFKRSPPDDEEPAVSGARQVGSVCVLASGGEDDRLLGLELVGLQLGIDAPGQGVERALELNDVALEGFDLLIVGARADFEHVAALFDHEEGVAVIGLRLKLNSQRAGLTGRYRRRGHLKFKATTVSVHFTLAFPAIERQLGTLGRPIKRKLAFTPAPGDPQSEVEGEGAPAIDGEVGSAGRVPVMRLVRRCCREDEYGGPAVGNGGRKPHDALILALGSDPRGRRPPARRLAAEVQARLHRRHRPGGATRGGNDPIKTLNELPANVRPTVLGQRRRGVVLCRSQRHSPLLCLQAISVAS